jgi:phospholipid/cholesterol/gamma-HCH transport system ATP-binding protein
MGPSGAGKTTLLRLITGEVYPDSGRVMVASGDVRTLSRADLLHLRLRMGVLFQQGALFSDLDVFENVAFPLRQHTDLPESLIRLVVLLKLHAVGLRGAAALMPAELSGGMQRRVALARAVALDPPVLLCDEPFVGLDPISTGVVMRLLKTLNAALHTTTVIVSHDVAEVEEVAHTSCILANGVIAASGRPSELRRDASGVVKQFLSGSPDGPVPFHYPAPDYATELLGLDDHR